MKRRTLVIPTKTDRPRRPRVKRAKVLVVLHSDGWAEVYGDDIDVCVMTKLDGEDNAAVEVMAEQFLDLELPRRFRPLHFPKKLRATGQCRRRTVAGEIKARQRLRFIRKCRSIGGTAK